MNNTNEFLEKSLNAGKKKKVHSKRPKQPKVNLEIIKSKNITKNNMRVYTAPHSLILQAPLSGMSLYHERRVRLLRLRTLDFSTQVL